jgi:hypothetical protein
MYIPVWLLTLTILVLPIIGGIIHHRRAYAPFEPTDPHPVRSWLAVIAIFAGAYVVVAVAGYGTLLGLGAMLDWLSS